MTTKNNEVANLTNKIQDIFTQTQAFFDTMNQGDRITAANLAAKITSVKLPAPDVLQMVTFYAQHSTEVFTARGKNGGIVKGTNPKSGSVINTTV